ncbi:MAG: adenosylcobinamide-GDP ribazoletransferase [Chlorobiales bacterium]|nr:adenosylcobinamide-GDP ribazoletransferase [Chlorobiales bacterium]
MREQLNILFSAIQFLTRLPVGRWITYDPGHLTKSVAYFPVVGALVGVLGAAVIAVMSLLVPPVLAVLFSMIATVVATGAIHEDGLADTIDGLGGGHTRERMMEIMKDSRVGSYGVIALWFSLTLKFVLLNELLTRDLWLAAGGLMLAHMLGRSSTVVLIYRYPYVRTEPGKAPFIVDSMTTPRLFLSLSFTFLFSVLLFGWKAFFVLAVASIATWLTGRHVNRRIGGITGDTLGAANQIVELSVYLALLMQANYLTLVALIWKYFSPVILKWI